MDTKTTPRPRRTRWETPAFEEVRVSAEVTAYMGVQEPGRK